MSKLGDFIFGAAGGPLPARVRQTIAIEEARAEILIGWAQLALVTFFVVLYSIAPKTSAGTPFMPVPYILSVYVAFSLLRLAVAYLWRLPNWFVV